MSTATSERANLQRVYRNLMRVMGHVMRFGVGSSKNEDVDLLNESIHLVEELLEQLGRGVHVNPALLMYGNPGRCLSKDVLAILYRHAEDGKEYCHGFGDADIRLSSRGDAVTIQGLKRRTGVGMYAGKDGETVTLRKPGVRLVEDF